MDLGLFAENPVLGVLHLAELAQGIMIRFVGNQKLQLLSQALTRTFLAKISLLQILPRLRYSSYGPLARHT